MMVEQFVEVCKRGLKVNAGKSKVMVVNGEEGLEYDVHIGFIYSMSQNSDIWGMF